MVLIMEMKKTHKLRIAVIVFAVIILIILFFPVPYTKKYSIEDAGSTGIRSFFKYGYDVLNCREKYRSWTVIDGVSYNYVSSEMRYLVGTRVSIFGIVVFDDTHPDPPLDEHMKYEEEVKELIDYYNSHRVDDIEIGSVSVNERDTRHVFISFGGVKKIETSDEIVKVIKGYLNDNPDSFIYDDFNLIIYTGYSEVIEKTATSETQKPYMSEYHISLPDITITELVLSPAMVPDTVPTGHDFEDVQKISFSFVGSVSEDRESVLRSMYPNAEIASE